MCDPTILLGRIWHKLDFILLLIHFYFDFAIPNLNLIHNLALESSNKRLLSESSNKHYFDSAIIYHN